MKRDLMEKLKKQQKINLISNMAAFIKQHFFFSFAFRLVWRISKFIKVLSIKIKPNVSTKIGNGRVSTLFPSNHKNYQVNVHSFF
jgi:hypothetical protein